jgi:hypothetical protein
MGFEPILGAPSAPVPATLKPDNNGVALLGNEVDPFYSVRHRRNLYNGGKKFEKTFNSSFVNILYHNFFIFSNKNHSPLISRLISTQ